MSQPLKKKYRQTTLLSFTKKKSVDSEPLSQDSDIICLDTPIPSTSGAMASSSRVNQTTAAGNDSQSSGGEAGNTSPIIDSSQLDSSLDILAGTPDSSATREVEHSPSLFSTDSSLDILGAEETPDQQTATVSYGDTVSTDGESQTTDTSDISVEQLKMFPTDDSVPRREKPSSKTHKVFIQTPTVPGEVPKPFSAHYVDCWDNDHVRMPCSSKNIYPDETNTNKTCNRWALIESSLTGGMTSSFDIEEAILRYNTRYKGKWNFSTLHQTINEEMTSSERDELFKQVLPTMVQLALSLPTLLPDPVPLLRQHVRYSLTFSQHQLASLLANAFFCTFPRRNATHRDSEYASFPTINFNGLFRPLGRRVSRESAMVHKLKCIFHYFKRVSQKMPTGCVTFKRKVVDGPSMLQWSQSTCTLRECYFTADQLIEDADRAVQADFANCYIGGGVLRTGCVQEEIQFLTHPELIVSCLFTERLADNEVMVIKGAEKYSNYIGYADTFEFSGNHADSIAFDDMGRRYRHIIAMDATRYGNKLSQYYGDSVHRELNKAYCGFHSNKEDPVTIATGNWGCGAFNGNHYLKGLLQLMVAAQCKRQLFYSVYGSVEVKQALSSFHQFCLSKGVTVGTLWKQILAYHKQADDKLKKTNPQSILLFIRKNLS